MKIETGLLADHLESIPALAVWFRAQWSGYFADWSQAELEHEFHSEARRDGLPIRLVALSEGILTGTIVLRERALSSVPDFSPGLGGLYVQESQRNSGVGTALVKAGMDAARKQGHAAVYATTVTAGGILQRLGWAPVKSITHNEELLTLYRFTFKPGGTTGRPTDE